MESFDFWKFLAGVGLFLWGMSQLELAIKELAGKPFKTLLQRSTDTGWKGILVGTFITAILQSSSLVTLMVLAFLGAGMISLKNSLGVVLGANLGTTFTAWIVAALGFKISVADFAYPFLAIGSMTYLFMNSRPNLRNSGVFLVGFGLLFLGLDFMKTSIDAIAEKVDFSLYGHLGLWVFLLIGLFVTALIQSSSAMIVIVLSALNAMVIDLHQALAIIIGANIGTTFTLVIGSIGGTADKRRLALANVIFKVIGGGIAYLLIDQIIRLCYNIFNLSDPLMELVLLNTIINLFMILIFYPFLGPIEKGLKQRFGNAEPTGMSRFVKNVTTDVPSVGIEILKTELNIICELTSKFVHKVIIKHQGPKKEASVWKKITYQPRDLLASYGELKMLEDELTAYGIALQEKKLNGEEASQLNSMMNALRIMVIGAKEFKDIIHNVKEMENSNESVVIDLLNDLRITVKQHLVSYQSTRNGEGEKKWPSELSLKNDHSRLVQKLYNDLRKRKADVAVSTMANAIQGVYSGIAYLNESLALLTDIETNIKVPQVDEGL